MDVGENPSLERQLRLPFLAGRRTSVFLAISAFLGLLQSLLAIFLSEKRLPFLPWFPAAVEAFCVGGGLSVALLCLGRYLFKKETHALGVGLAFWLSSLFSLAYLLAQQGVFLGLPPVAAYFFYLLYLTLFLALLFAPGEAKSLPPNSKGALLTIFGYNSLLCLMVIGGIILLEGYLPPLLLYPRAAFLSRFLPYTFFFLYLAAIYAQWQRLKRLREPLAAYFFGFLVISLWVFSGMILSREPYDIAWYSYHVIRAFAYVAVYLALLLEYADLYRELAETMERMALTHRLNALVAGSLSLEEIYQTLSRGVQRLVPYDRLAISLLRQQVNSVTVFSDESRLPAPPIAKDAPVGIEGTATGWVIQNREPLVCKDLLNDQRFPVTHTRYRNVGLRSYVILPLIAKGKMLGVLNLSSLRPDCYGRKEVEILSPVSELLSVGIENAELLQALTAKSQELQSANLRLNRLLKEQSALREIFTQINLLDLGHLLHQLAEQALALLQVDHIQVRLVDPSGALQTAALTGTGSERFRTQVSRSGTSRSTWVMENRRPLAIKNISQDKIYGPGRLMREMGVKGYLCVPMIARDQKSFGVLLATSLKEREFTQEEIALAQQLAAGAAVAIENARLFEDLQKKSQELEYAYQTKSEFLNTMAHELRTPLNVLITTMQLFTEGFYGELTEQQVKGFEPMQRNAINLLDLISSILDLARLEVKRVPLQIEEFPLKEITDETESSFMSLAKEKGLELRFKIEDPTLTLKSDKSKVRTVLQNLLGNAVKYTDRGEIELRITTLIDHQGDKSAADISIAVEDTGIGIKESDLPHIFETFYMAEGVNRRKYPGSGLGLSIVKRLLELLHGDLHVQSEWGKGSTFTVTLPLVCPPTEP